MNKSEELIACLEGEIAKRDEELAACRVAVENCEVFRARIAELERQLNSDKLIKMVTELREELAAIKAQGVVIDADDLAQFIREIDGNHKMGAGVLAEHIVARLNAAPAQQVSVPDDEAVMAKARKLFGWAYDLGGFPDAVRDLVAFAHPAAPAADAPPENCRQRLAAEGKPYPKSSCAACGQFSPKWRECDAALAAHRSKGVV